MLSPIAILIRNLTKIYRTVYLSSTTVTSTTITTSQVSTSITTIIIPTTIVNPVLQRRYTDGDILAIPTYLSMCSSAARLSSACSCIGITAATVTQSTILPTSVSLGWKTLKIFQLTSLRQPRLSPAPLPHILMSRHLQPQPSHQLHLSSQ
jgi:hypothetical protein